MGTYIKAKKDLLRQEGDDFTVEVYFPKEMSILNQELTFSIFRKDCPFTTSNTISRVGGITTTNSTEIITKTVGSGVTITEVTVQLDGVDTLYDKVVITFTPTDTRGYGGDTYDYELEIDTTAEGESTILYGDFELTAEKIK